MVPGSQFALDERDCEPSDSRHFPQLDLSTVVAPSGGVQQTALQERGSGHRTSKPAQERGPLFIWQDGARSPQPERRSFVFLHLPGIRHAFVSEALKPLWDANSTPVCWGCQEGIPIYCISVLASGMLPSLPAFFHKANFAKIQVAHSSRATSDLPLFEFSVACQVAVQNSGPLTPASRLVPRCGASDPKWKISPVQQGPLLNGGTHGYVDILENFTRRDSLRAVGGFHKIVASLTAMFTTERIPELQRTGELLGSNQKSRPIDLPFAFYFPHFVPPLGEGNYSEFGFSACNAVLLAGFSS